MANTQYNLLDDDGTLFLVNYIFTKLKNSPLNTNTTYTLSKNDVTKKYVLTGSDGTSTSVDFFEYAKATASADGLMSKEDFSKLANIASGAQVNIIEKVKVNGTELTVDTTDKSVNVVVITESTVDSKIATAIAGITAVHFEKVQTLPASGSSNVIYLLPKSPSQTGNIYEEYIWIDNAWEKIGETVIDLSNYVQYSDISLITNAELTDIVDDAYTDVFGS